MEAERARDEAVRLFEISMAHAPFGNVVVDTAGVVLQANPAVCELLHCTEKDIVGVDFRRFVHPDNLDSGNSEFAALVDGSTPVLSSERKYLRADGTEVWLQRDFVLVPGVPGGQDVAVAQFQDVTARKRAEAALAQLAVTDQLTGLHNRHALVECVGRMHAAAPEQPVGVFFIDLDGFKHVNDTHGHAVGDAVLAAAAQRLAQLIGPPNTAYRLGGDEFVVLAPAARTDGEPELVRRIGDTLSGPYDAGGTAVSSPPPWAMLAAPPTTSRNCCGPPTPRCTGTRRGGAEPQPVRICAPRRRAQHWSQTSTGLNRRPHAVWVTTTAGPSGSGNQCCAHARAHTRTGNRARPFSVSRYRASPCARMPSAMNTASRPAIVAGAHPTRSGNR